VVGACKQPGFTTAQVETVVVVLMHLEQHWQEAKWLLVVLVVLMHLEQRWLEAERLLSGLRRGVRLRIAGELAPLPM
jgi:hypothetical protein